MDDSVLDAFANLTPRQRECLELAAQHWTSKDIGRHLGISPKTVDRHLEDVIRKLGVPDRLAAIRLLRTVGPAPTRAEPFIPPSAAPHLAHGDHPHAAYAPQTRALASGHQLGGGGETTHG